MREAVLYEPWENGHTADVSPRTYLYRLQPVGIGSTFVESLTGYIARLAYAHSVSVGAMLTREILPRVQPGCFALERDYRTHSCMVYNTRTANGVAEASDKLSALLEDLTGSKDLSALTLRSWAGVISAHHLLKTKKDWCAACLHDWRTNGNEIYDPLLWAINGVTVCPVHHCRLSSNCPHCGRSLHVLSARSRPGLCCWCQRWIGYANAIESTGADAGRVTSDWITDLIAATQRSEHYLSLDVFRRNLDMCIERVSDGNISRFCRITGLSFDTVVDWRSGTVHVRLDLLLKLCRALGFTPKTVLTANLEDSDVHDATAFPLTKTTPVGRRRSPAHINNLLTQALHAEPPISLRELATRLGYAAIQGLTRRFPEICASLRKKYNAANRRKLAKPFAHAPSDKVIRKAIEAALASRPRTTLRKVTQTLGFRNEVSLYNRFPELCRAFAAANRKDRAERLAIMRAECLAALQQGTPPSIREIAARVGCSEQAFSYRFPDLYAGLVQAAPERKRLLREEVRSQISVALHEDPAPSLDCVASRVGKNALQLLAQHPDVAREIRSRYNARQQADGARRHAQYREQIRTAADDLSERGLPLSRKKIMAAIPSPVMNHCRIVDDELRNIRQQLRGDQV